jgi:phenylacetate-CoA ligase
VKDLELFYERLPIPLQQAACSLEGWRVQRSRYGGRYPALLEAAEARGRWSDEEWIAYRDARLRAMVEFCARHVPYYRGEFRKLGIGPEEIRTLADLRQLPVLTKATVQDRMEEFRPEVAVQGDLKVAHTSGTSGAGLRFVTTLEAQQEQWAIWWRYRRWHGIEPGTWCGYFGGRSVVPLRQQAAPFWRLDWPGRQLLFSAYHMEPRNLPGYIEELRRRRPPWLHGYPSLLALVAMHLVEHGEDLGYAVRWITTGAENLLPQQRAVMEKAFGVAPRQHYGMTEAVANASECEYGSLHVDEDFAAVEFVADGAGEGLRVVGTNLTNRATPLLRYEVQDHVRLSGERCACGRPGRVMTGIDGRAEDYIILGNGARLGRLDHIFKDLIHVREAQIVQREIGAVTIRYVPTARHAEEDEQRLLAEARRRLGRETRITLETAAELQRSPSGKLRFVVNELPAGRLEAVGQGQPCGKY